jgi:hypothetical protein
MGAPEVELERMIHPVGVPMSLCPIAPPFATSHPGAHRRGGFLLYEKYSGFLASDVLEIMFHTLFVVFSVDSCNAVAAQERACTILLRTYSRKLKRKVCIDWNIEKEIAKER